MPDRVPARCLEGAECLFDPELHDGPDHEADEDPCDRAAREEIAKEICGTCPVRDACLEYALRAKPDRGIWAGRTAAEITVLTDIRAQNEHQATNRDAYRGLA